ncbi:MAG: ribosome silencing factor [Gordonia sp. (in: high G+C Gram-positive bacteria)]|uniref:ribosome silencing factor n=1 Tax=Gordonia sp. (in: high G+C Gram-positive bacteria) TaxID=84139 RepID=UPI003BB50687
MTATPQALALATIAANAAADRKATDIVVLDVSETLVITDLFLIASADNERQVNAITEEIEDQLRAAGHSPLRREGVRDGRWALLDYGDVVVHIQHDDEREFYGLQRLWADGPTVEIEGLERPESDPV